MVESRDEKAQDQKINAEKFKAQGNAAFNEHRYNSAIQCYTESLRLQKNYIVLSNRAQCYININQYELALRDVNESIRIEPSFIKNWNRRAKALTHLGMVKEAHKSSQTALSIVYNDPTALQTMKTIASMDDEDLREVRQWNGGMEFDEDEMVSVCMEEPAQSSASMESTASSGDSLSTVTTILAAPSSGKEGEQSTSSLSTTSHSSPENPLCTPPPSELARGPSAVESWKEAKDQSFSSIYDLQSATEDQPTDSDDCTNARSTPNDAVEKEKVNAKSEELNVSLNDTHESEEDTVVEKDEGLVDPDTIVPEETTVEESTDPASMAPKKNTVEESTDPASITPKKTTVGESHDPTTIVPEETTVDAEQSEITGDALASENKGEEGVVTVETEKPLETTVAQEKEETPHEKLPVPENYLEFVVHFNHLKNDAEAFGSYFIAIDPSLHFSIFSNLIEGDHLTLIIEGFLALINKDRADLAAVAASLCSISLLPRFDLIILFMSDATRTRALHLIDLLPASADVATLREIFH